QAAGRAEIVDPAEELPGPSAIIARENLGPHDPARVALAAQHAKHAPARQHIAARVEPAVAAEAEGALVVALRRAVGIALRGDEGQEVEVGAARRQREDAGSP